jgi:hypothetical protein
MPNILILSLEGFAFSSRQLYQELLPKLLSRAIVHEALDIGDALHYICSGWCSYILVTDAVIAKDDPESNRLLAAVAAATKSGCTTVLMGFFSQSVRPQDLNILVRDGFGLSWESAMVGSSLETILSRPDPSIIRLANLEPIFRAEAHWLQRVPPAERVYMATHMGMTLAHSAIGRVGFGKLGYIGDINPTEESERTILAMCHLDHREARVRLLLRDDSTGSPEQT